MHIFFWLQSVYETSCFFFIPAEINPSYVINMSFCAWNDCNFEKKESNEQFIQNNTADASNMVDPTTIFPHDVTYKTFIVR